MLSEPDAVSGPQRDDPDDGYGDREAAQGVVPSPTKPSNGVNVSAGSTSGSGALLKDATVTFAARVLAIALSVGLASATAWLLGPGGRGELAICLIFAQLLVLGLGFGVEMGCAYYAGRRPEQIGSVLGTQLVAFGVTAVLMTGVGVACLRSPLPFVQKVSGAALACAIMFAVTQLFFVFMSVLFMGLGRLTEYNLARVGGQAVTLVALLVAYWMVPSITVAVAAYVVGSLLAGSFLAVSLARGRLASSITFSWSMITACYRYGIRYYFGKLATLVDVQMGVIVIAMAGTTEQAGLFAAALGMVSRLWILPETLNIVLLPRVLTEQSALGELVLRCCRVTVIATAVAGCLLAVLARPIVAVLLSPAFLPAVSPLLVLLPGAVMGGTTRVLASYFNGTGRPGLTSTTLIVGLALNVTLVIVLLPRWGLLGAATAASTAYIVEAVLAMFLFVRLTGRSWREFLPQAADCRTIRSLLRRRGRSRPE